MDPKISVIVPVYNVAKYLRECLDSIVNQTYQNIEIVVVDDGSTDGSSEICDEYAQSDNRITVYHKKNGGLGAAYNYGLSHAIGEYIAFVESDDWVEPNMIELLYKRALETQAEIIKAPFWNYDSIQTIDCKRNVLFFTNEMINFHEILKDQVFNIEKHPEFLRFHASIWSYLYKADFVKQIRFVEAPGAAYVDLPFAVEVLCKAKTISVIDQPILHWRNDSKEHTHSTNEGGPGMLAIFDRIRESLGILKSCNKQDTLLELFWVGTVACLQFFYKKVRLEYKEDFWDCMKRLFHEFDCADLLKKSSIAKREYQYVNYVLHHGYQSYWPTSFEFSQIKRWVFSIHLNRSKGFIIQFLGIQYSTREYAHEMRPALFALRRS